MNTKIERIISALEDIERLPLAIVTMIGPWCTPLIPAYFVSVAIVKYLNAPNAVAVAAGFVLEVVGIAGIANATRAYMWNRTKRKTDPTAPLGLSIAAVSIYFITAMLLTVVLEFFGHLAPVAPAAFIILSISSGLILVLSNMQRVRESEVETERKEKRQSRRQKRQPIAGNQTATEPAKHAFTTDITRQRAAAILTERSDISGAELGRILGKSERTGRYLKTELLPELNGNHNGNGYNAN